MAKERNESIDLTMWIRDDVIKPYEIKVDENCYYVMRVLKAKESGNRVERPVGYFGNLVGALRRIANNKVLSEESELTVEKYIDRVEQMFENLTEKVKI